MENYTGSAPTYLNYLNANDPDLKIPLIALKLPEIFQALAQPQPSSYKFKDHISPNGTGADSKILWATLPTCPKNISGGLQEEEHGVVHYVQGELHLSSFFLQSIRST